MHYFGSKHWRALLGGKPFLFHQQVHHFAADVTLARNKQTQNRDRAVDAGAQWQKTQTRHERIVRKRGKKITDLIHILKGKDRMQLIGPFAHLRQCRGFNIGNAGRNDQQICMPGLTNDGFFLQLPSLVQ